MPLFYDWTMILILPALALSMWAQAKVKSSFAKYSRIPTRKHMTGAQVAEAILRNNGIYDVQVRPVGGFLSDHYNPSSKTVSLSKEIYSGTSISSVAIAAHECGHAIQHNRAYIPLTLRSAIFPVVNISSQAAIPLFFIGMLLKSVHLLDLGIILFSASVLFNVITLPVEFDASARALKQIDEYGFLVEDERRGAKKVLTSAALTYVAAAAMAAMQLLRLILIRGSRD